jgi:hypothetical protein
MFVCGRKAALSGQTVENFSLPRQRGGQEILRRPSLDAHATFLTAARTFSASRRRTERIPRHFDLKVSLTLLISIANRRPDAELTDNRRCLPTYHEGPELDRSAFLR